MLHFWLLVGLVIATSALSSDKEKPWDMLKTIAFGGPWTSATLLSPQPMLVIGAGFGRTGTDSLRAALTMLGYHTHHMGEIMKNGDSGVMAKANSPARIEEFLDLVAQQQYNATTDFPLSLFYKVPCPYCQHPLW
jgi:hypothetical protein